MLTIKTYRLYKEMITCQHISKKVCLPSPLSSCFQLCTGDIRTSYTSSVGYRKKIQLAYMAGEQKNSAVATDHSVWQKAPL